MKNGLKKKMVALMAVCMLFCVTGANVSAATDYYIYTTNGSMKFNSAWERYKTGDSGNSSLTYGYNTFLINEDYAWANHSTRKHKAVISNAKGAFCGKTKKAKKVSEIEIQHKGTFVEYMCSYMTN